MLIDILLLSMHYLSHPQYAPSHHNKKMGKSKSDKIIIDTLGNDEFMGDILADHYPPE